MQATYILLNPTNRYAERIMLAARRDLDLRPLIVWPSQREALFWRPYVPLLQTGIAFEEFFLDKIPLPALLRTLRAAYQVMGVIAYQEPMVNLAAEMGLGLGLLAPPQAEVLHRFRNKAALKAHIRAHHPEVRLNATRLVRSLQELLAEPLPAKFVLKPNDGMANRDVGFFSAATPPAELAQYVEALAGTEIILEEFLEGPEFAVNGQVDHEGKAHVFNLTRYERVAGNGKPNLYRFCHHVRRSEASFAAIEAYARQVVEATGLQRSPFHMEIMLTPNGPSLIEVGARFGGLDYVYLTNTVHQERLDHFAIATHYWLSPTAYAGAWGNWDYYDQVSLLQLDGIAKQGGRLYRVEGTAAIEAMPEFHAWVTKPSVGQQLQPTVDLFTIPYSFQFKAKVDPDVLMRRALQAEAHLRFNRRVGLWQRGRVEAQALQTRVLRRARLLADTLLSR